ncbi:hypothetical protein NPX13_g4410 [Xylaria arbuscula]|uniref:Uncharacterized protein n=1 Tax=Xylaria arbuscula TaxID=114810 RepID=A0A9W8NGK3_9PEZI|nr:hypothetical protein NPX13_g4410 [Xylaria arbuscula]
MKRNLGILTEEVGKENDASVTEAPQESVKQQTRILPQARAKELKDDTRNIAESSKGDEDRQELQRRSGVCEIGYEWIKEGYGYRCARW